MLCVLPARHPSSRWQVVRRKREKPRRELKLLLRVIGGMWVHYPGGVHVYDALCAARASIVTTAGGLQRWASVSSPPVLVWTRGG